MSVSARTRFEVFKRDKFTCQYCGKKAPDVVLHCDHIEPASKGGSDDMINLVTACDTCNGGKGAVRLADDSAVEKQRTQLERLQERQEQIEMMLRWHKSLSAVDEDAIQALANRWCDLSGWFGVNAEGVRDLKKWVRKFGVEAVLEAMPLAAETYFKFAQDEDESPTSESANLAFNKIGGVCRVRAETAKTPWLQDAFYVRGILRRRHENGDLHYLNDRDAFDVIKFAFEAGADFDDLKEIAKRARSWTMWRENMAEYLTSIGGDARQA